MRLKKKVKQRLLTIIIVILVLVVGILIWKSIHPKEKEVKEVKVVSKIDKYGYNLKENKTTTYKSMFKELEDILNAKEVDEEKYASKIAEMFIYDFYSLEDKTAKTDIGGVEFIYNDILENFLQNAQNTYYKYVENNIYGNRNQKLPVVKDIEITNIEKSPYAYRDKTDENAYKISLSWDYTSTDFSNYQKTATIVLIHDDIKLSIVELQK